jgi:hypothetical protein
MLQIQKDCRQEIVLVLPILPGKSEAWRRFIQEMLGSRRLEYEASRHRLGIYAERIWISQVPLGKQAIITMETEDLEQVLLSLANSAAPFDDWFRNQVLALQGLDLTQSPHRILPDLISEWRAV